MSRRNLDLTRIGKEKRPKLESQRRLFTQQDEIEARRIDLIIQLEAQLQQQVEECRLFTVEWELE